MAKYLYSLEWQQQAGSVPWLRWLVAGNWLHRLGLTTVYAGFVFERVALGQIFAWMLQFFPVSIVPPMLSAHSSVPVTV